MRCTGDMTSVSFGEVVKNGGWGIRKGECDESVIPSVEIFLGEYRFDHFIEEEIPFSLAILEQFD